VLNSLLFWESMRFVSSVAVVMIHVLDAKYTGTFAYVKQRAPVAVSDRAILYIYMYIRIYIYTHTAKLTKIVVSSDKLTYYVEWQNHWMLHIIYCIVCTVVCVASYN
jgi:hypothetical protein